MMMESNWFALHVKSRHEFVVSGELQRKGIETFLPSVTKLSQWKDRRKRVEFPLFPGYLFVSIAPEPEQFMNVIKTRGTVTFISLEPGYPAPVALEEINALKIILAGNEQIDIYPRLKAGSRVRVRSGVFEGAYGVLEKKEGLHMLLVGIELLGRSVGVKIHAEEVEAA